MAWIVNMPVPDIPASSRRFPSVARIGATLVERSEMLIKAYQLGEANAGGRAGFTLERGWENWCRLTDRPYYRPDWNMGPGFSGTDG